MTIRRCTQADIPAMCEIINDGAQRYRGAVPADCLHDPYMPVDELQHEVNAGVEFWGWEDGASGALKGVMGIQRVRDVTLIRHAYVASDYQGRGAGSALLKMLIGQARGTLLVGTWAAATWAIQLYERHGFLLAPPEEKDRLLDTYWTISDRQRETSVVLRYVGTVATPS